MDFVVRLLIVLSITIFFSLITTIIISNITDDNSSPGTGALGKAISDLVSIGGISFIVYLILFSVIIFKYI